MVRTTALVAAAALCLATPPIASADVLLHSDLPLWNPKEGPIWPKQSTGGGAPGCASRIRIGAWELSHPDNRDTTWLALTNYGVFHCAYIYMTADSREGLNDGMFEKAWLLDLGELKSPSGPLDLYALLIGSTGGSDYLLLSTPSSGEVISEISLLDPECPKSAIRKGPTHDIWGSDYCVVTSRTMLREIAVEATGRRPKATGRYDGPTAKDTE